MPNFPRKGRFCDKIFVDRLLCAWDNFLNFQFGAAWLIDLGHANLCIENGDNGLNWIVNGDKHVLVVSIKELLATL